MTAAATPGAPDALPRLVDQFRLEAKIGQGGMGVVYRAVDVTLDRPVAVKLIALNEELSEKARETAVKRFIREAKAAARIQSRHVCQVLQHGETRDGQLYIAMELLEGIPLSRLLAKEGRLPALRAVHFARQICRGLHVAHQLGIVHRDLKAPNIMIVSADGDDDIVKVLDFGVAKLTADSDAGSTTQQGTVVGTLNIMAPEQIEGHEVDGRADIYALGIMLYRMLTGTQLFDSTDVAAIIRHQLKTAPQPLRERAPDADIPPALDELVLRCLAKDAAGRPASMKELERALAAAVGLETSGGFTLPSVAKTAPHPLDENTGTPSTKSAIEVALPQRSLAAAVAAGVGAVVLLAILAAVALLTGREPPAMAPMAAATPAPAPAPAPAPETAPPAAPAAPPTTAAAPAAALAEPEAPVETKPRARPATPAAKAPRKKPAAAAPSAPADADAPKLKRVRTKVSP